MDARPNYTRSQNWYRHGHYPGWFPKPPSTPGFLQACPNVDDVLDIPMFDLDPVNAILKNPNGYIRAGPAYNMSHPNETAMPDLPIRFPRLPPEARKLILRFVFAEDPDAFTETITNKLVDLASRIEDLEEKEMRQESRWQWREQIKRDIRDRMRERHDGRPHSAR